MRPLDPVFGLPTPLLFAHRGGAREVPESTPLALAHALDARADVLELDVSLTRDRELVVWHGPDLDNVRLDAERDDPQRRARRELAEFDWPELAGRAFVDDRRRERGSLAHVPRDPARRLLRLVDLLALQRTRPLSIELKGDFGPRDVQRLVDTLEVSSARERRVLLVRARGGIDELEAALAALPPARRRRYATGFSAREALFAPLAALLPGGPDVRRREIQTSHAFCPARVVADVHRRGGAVHVFITGFGPIPGLDAEEGRLDRESLFELLDRGVDGIVTDRPREVRRALDDWIAKS
jgi:glycerophosphoryl diester phosphodiesterase